MSEIWSLFFFVFGIIWLLVISLYSGAACFVFFATNAFLDVRVWIRLWLIDVEWVDLLV